MSSKAKAKKEADEIRAEAKAQADRLEAARDIPMSARQAQMIQQLDATITEMSNRRAVVLMTIVNGATDEEVDVVGYDTEAKTVRVADKAPAD